MKYALAWYMSVLFTLLHASLCAQWQSVNLVVNMNNRFALTQGTLNDAQKVLVLTDSGVVDVTDPASPMNVQLPFPYSPGPIRHIEICNSQVIAISEQNHMAWYDQSYKPLASYYETDTVLDCIVTHRGLLCRTMTGLYTYALRNGSIERIPLVNQRNVVAYCAEPCQEAFITGNRPNYTLYELDCGGAVTKSERIDVPEKITALHHYEDKMYIGTDNAVYYYDSTSYTPRKIDDLVLNGYPHVVKFITYSGDLYSLNYGMGFVYKHDSRKWLDFARVIRPAAYYDMVTGNRYVYLLSAGGLYYMNDSPASAVRTPRSSGMFIEIYPTIVTDNVSIRMKGTHLRAVRQWCIYSVNGNRMLRGDVDEGDSVIDINAAQLTPGVYFMLVNTALELHRALFIKM